MATYMEKLDEQATISGIQRNSDESRKWFAQKLQEARRSPNRQSLLKDPDFQKTSVSKMSSRTLYGRMFMYFYDPKTKDTLPYYDRFPLIFLVEKANRGFYGLNMHYLPPKLRAKFFDRLLDYSNNEKYDSTTRLRLKYSFLQKSSRLEFFKPCFKHYLTSQVVGKIVEIPANEWESVLFLPTEFFKKKRAQSVWADSRETILGG